MADMTLLSNTGTKFSEYTTKLIKFFSDLGLNLNQTQGKILSFLIVLGLLYLVIKTMEKPIKYLFIAGLIILAISIVSSFFIV